jgi:Regulator of ribonuclease activity B
MKFKMFEGIRSLLGAVPKRSETDQKLDEALATAKELDHYFFFANQIDAERAALQLQNRGWTIKSVGMNTDVEKAQLQARQPGPIENLAQLQTELDLFADEFDGEYDGWQVPGVTENL